MATASSSSASRSSLDDTNSPVLPTLQDTPASDSIMNDAMDGQRNDKTPHNSQADVDMDAPTGDSRMLFSEYASSAQAIEVVAPGVAKISPVCQHS